MEGEIFLFCVITVEPMKIQTCSALQNDGLNFSFVKYIKVVVKKMARNGRKTAIRAGGWRRLPQTMILAYLLLNDLWTTYTAGHLCPHQIYLSPLDLKMLRRACTPSRNSGSWMERLCWAGVDKPSSLFMMMIAAKQFPSHRPGF